MNETRRQFPRLMALFLAVILILSMAPGSVLAAETEPAEVEAVTEETIAETSSAVASDEIETKEPPPTDSEDPVSNPTETAECTDPQSTTETIEEVKENSSVSQEKENKLTTPVRLNTEAQYYDHYFALLHAAQENLSYHILTKDAAYQNPTIWAYPFEIDPDIPSIGFEIQLEGVNYVQETMVNPGAEVMIQVNGLFQNSNPQNIGIFDVSNDSWKPLVLDTYYSDSEASSFTFYAPEINSRFAIVELNSDAALYNTNYGSTIGNYVPMSVNNKSAWCVAGKNSFGFGNSATGTFDIHLVSKSSLDSGGKTVGYQDYVAAGCLEPQKAAPSITEGQIVTAAFGGDIGGWRSLSKSQRIKITGYMLYGVRYLSDYSFDNKLGHATIYSQNPVVNMAYAQQILIWSVVKGVDPNAALSKYANDVPAYGRRIMELASENPEKYDYENTVMLVGEGNSKQDLVIVLEPKKEKPPAGEVIVDKSVTGSNQLSGWQMELYNSYWEAESGINPVATATTDSNGRASFGNVLNGTYYVREADAYKQSGDLTYWTLSDKILTVTVNSNSAFAGTIHNSYAPNKSYGLHKSSKCSNAVAQQLKGNPFYSLAGAKYEVSLNGQRQEVLTTDESGNAKGSLSYPAGTKLTIQEIEAPAGYKLDSTVHTLLITEGDNVLEVQDEPLMDPPFALTKVDKDSVTPQGNASFQGAIFKWEFYNNDCWSGIPSCTWYFETNEKGVVDYSSSFLADGYSSDAIFLDNFGNPSLPLGSLKMTEIQNPLGYLVLPEPLKCRIMVDESSAAGVSNVFEEESLKYIQNISVGNFGVIESINKDLYGSIQVDKVDAVTGSVPQGNTNLQAVFQIVNRSQNAVKIQEFAAANPGEVCYEFTTDADGHFASGKIFPIGKYEITEKTAPKGYQLNKDWSQVFEVTENVNAFDFTASSGMACADSLELFGSITMDKLDMETGSVPQGDATLAGAEFEIINNSSHPISWQDRMVDPGQPLMTFKVDDTGHYSYQGLPMGSYYIQEITPPEGYLLDLVWMYDFSITPDNQDVVVHPDMTCQDQPVKGGIRVIKQDALHGGETSESDPLTGISFSVVNESKNPVVIDGTVYDPGEVVAELKIAWDGSKWSASTEQNLPYGTYSVTENEMFPGMANEWYKRNPEKHMVEVHGGDSLVEVTHTNEMVEGKIIIHKVDPVGTPLSGATFLLEWSDDHGQTWNPVTNSQVLVKGGCSAPELVDGKFTTGADGLVEFTKLYPSLKYRVTEVCAPEGYVLLRDYAYSDFPPEYEYVYEMTVHNSPGFTFPTTGSNSLQAFTMLGLALVSLALLAAGYYVVRKMVCSREDKH